MHLGQFIRTNCVIDGIISLPAKTFFTTSKKTYILCLTKKLDSSVSQTDKVFTYFVSEIGESRDAYRFYIEEDDLSEAAILYTLFKGNKNNFSKFNKDPRCKIFSIDFFDPDKNWCVDRWWNDEEKVSLGLSFEGEKVKFEEIPNMLNDISENIISLKNKLYSLTDESSSGSVRYDEYKISDVFDLVPIKGLTKSFINNNEGDIPVYGGGIKEIPIGSIKNSLEGVKYFENCLAWNREGSVGYVFWHKHIFSTNDHHRPMIPKR